jgi:hypothetical protein
MLNSYFDDQGITKAIRFFDMPNRKDNSVKKSAIISVELIVMSMQTNTAFLAFFSLDNLYFIDKLYIIENRFAYSN